MLVTVFIFVSLFKLYNTIEQANLIVFNCNVLINALLTNIVNDNLSLSKLNDLVNSRFADPSHFVSHCTFRCLIYAQVKCLMFHVSHVYCSSVKIYFINYD